MSLLLELNNIIGNEAVACVVFDLVNKPSAMQRYLCSARGIAAKKKASAAWRIKERSVDDAGRIAVENHIAAWRTEFVKDVPLCDILTNLWNHYKTAYVLHGKPNLTRQIYKAHLETLHLATRNPHMRHGVKYYVEGYEITH